MHTCSHPSQIECNWSLYFTQSFITSQTLFMSYFGNINFCAEIYQNYIRASKWYIFLDLTF